MVLRKGKPDRCSRKGEMKKVGEKKDFRAVQGKFWPNSWEALKSKYPTEESHILQEWSCISTLYHLTQKLAGSSPREI